MEETDKGAKPKNVRDLWAEPEPEKPPELVEEAASSLELKAEDPEKEDPEEGAIPSWAQDYLPANFRIPRGKQVTFMRFPSAWTDEPEKGVKTVYRKGKKGGPYTESEALTRVIVIWPLSLAEANQARKRAKQPRDTLEELTKQMIRACDGRRADWSGSWAKDPENLVDVNSLWRELGIKVHPLLQNAYMKMHSLDDEQLADFYLNCIASASAVAG